MVTSPLCDVTRKVCARQNTVLFLSAQALDQCCKVLVKQNAFRYNPYGFKAVTREYPTPKTVVTPKQWGARDSKPVPPMALTTVVTPTAPAPVSVPAPAPSRAPSPVPALVLACGSSNSSEAGEVQPIVCRVSIGFKHTEELYASRTMLSVGDVVAVEGDRGRDIGVVSAVLEVRGKYIACVIGHATAAEKAALAQIRKQEESAVKLVQQRCKECGLKTMKIEDAEFQLDGAKLTIFFSSPGPVDFRQLQRVLFRDFRCRVWIRNMPGTY